jgi:hypothetical protein
MGFKVTLPIAEADQMSITSVVVDELAQMQEVTITLSMNDWCIAECTSVDSRTALQRDNNAKDKMEQYTAIKLVRRGARKDLL